MKTLSLILVSMVMALSLVVVGISPIKSAMAAKQITGEVVTADPSLKTLVVKVKNADPMMEREMTFDVTKKTEKILADLKPGDQVSIQFSESDGKFTAESIRKS